MFRPSISDFKTLTRFLAGRPAPSPGIVLLALLALPHRSGHAQEAPRLQPSERIPDTQLLLGPSVSAIHRDRAWDSQVGAQLQLHHARESLALSAVGALLGVSTFARYEGVRLGLDLYLGSELFESLPLGVALGGVGDLFRDHRPRGGLRAQVWAYAGVAPYAGITAMYGLGAPSGLDLEFGLKIPFSIASW